MLNAEGGSCPEAAISRIIEEVEDSWNLSIPTRLYRSAVFVTDGVLFDGKLNKATAGVKRVSTALRNRCTATSTFSTRIGNGLTKEEALNQGLYLRVLAGTGSNIFQIGTNLEFYSVLAIIAQLGRISIENAKLPQCQDKEFYNNDKTNHFCGFVLQGMCLNREFCRWIAAQGKISSGCYLAVTECAKYENRPSCSKNKCIWKNGGCFDKE